MSTWHVNFNRIVIQNTTVIVEAKNRLLAEAEAKRMAGENGDNFHWQDSEAIFENNYIDQTEIKKIKPIEVIVEYDLDYWGGDYTGCGNDFDTMLPAWVELDNLDQYTVYCMIANSEMAQQLGIHPDNIISVREKEHEE